MFLAIIQPYREIILMQKGNLLRVVRDRMLKVMRRKLKKHMHTQKDITHYQMVIGHMLKE